MRIRPQPSIVPLTKPYPRLYHYRNSMYRKNRAPWEDAEPSLRDAAVVCGKPPRVVSKPVEAALTCTPLQSRLCVQGGKVVFSSDSSALPRFVVLILLTTTVFGAVIDSQSSKLIKAGSPQPVALAGYDKAHCVSLPSQIRICKCISESEDGTFIVERKGKRLSKWPASAFLGDTSDLEVLLGDLDGDGSNELVVANRDSESCGMAVQQWTLSVFPNPGFPSFQAPLTFSVEDYGVFGTFAPARVGVNILTTEWISMEDPKRQRGRGEYLIGKWWK